LVEFPQKRKRFCRAARVARGVRVADFVDEDFVAIKKNLY
jgi:hypothetical protein|tara:strand:- start:2125 stop:2244 length:120 start_codon:yes stop_codon:yes gene_type:complete